LKGNDLSPEAVREAARLLIEARDSGILLDRLPEDSRPKNAGDAYAIQLETVARMGARLSGWKVALSKEYDLLMAALVEPRTFEDGATIPSARMSIVGVEAEIAFRFDKALPPREAPYETAEVAEAVTAFPAIEILDTRFRDYHGTSVIDRAADFMSNSAFVVGRTRPDWRDFDLAKANVRLEIDGVETVRVTGGHASGDPLIPAIALANHLRKTDGVPSGYVMTTGSYTGLQFIKKDSFVKATFAGFGEVGCRLAS
jgi:2-keto-4-pentenoate hydratase